MAKLLRLVRWTILFLVAGCGNLTCDQQKQESMKHNNEGIKAAESQSYAKAAEEFKQALALDPENYNAAYNLAQILIEQRKWSDAESALEMAIKYRSNDAMYHYHLGHARLEQKKMDAAMTSLQEAVKLEPRLFKAHYYLGMVHVAKEQPKQAAEEFMKSATLNPTFGKPFYELGKLYYLWDHYPEAVQVLVQGAANAKEPDDLSDIYHQLGMSYDALKQYDKSVEAYTKAVETRKDNLDAKFHLGMALAAKGDKANARKYLEEFVKSGGAGNNFLIGAANDRLLKLSGE